MNTGTILALMDGGYQEMTEALFADVAGRPDVISSVEHGNADPFIALLRKRRVQKLLPHVCSFFLEHDDSLTKTLEEAAKRYDGLTVLFLNSTIRSRHYPLPLLAKWKKKYHLRYVLYYFDIMDRQICIPENEFLASGLVDVCYSFSKADCEGHGDVIFWPTPYSVLPEMQAVRAKRDLYFCGVDNGRGGLLRAVGDAGAAHGADVRMEVVACAEGSPELENSPNIRLLDAYKGYRGYKEVLKNTLDAGCLLEITMKGQTAPTLRAYEAAAYGRKLLTNNPDIREWPLYDPENMRVFERAEEIDWQWVKTPATPRPYNGELSPRRLIEDMNRRLYSDRK